MSACPTLMVLVTASSDPDAPPTIDRLDQEEACRGLDEATGQRVSEGELACRTDGEGRHYLAGIVVPYGRRSEPVTIGRLRTLEMFAARAAEVDTSRGMVLRSRHPDPQLRGADRVDTIIGRMTEYRQTDDGLWAEFRMSRDPEAERLWGMADDGTLVGLSVEYSMREGYQYRDLPAPERGELPLRIISRAPVRGCALVDHGAYADAGVAITRASADPMTADELSRWTRLDDVNRRLEILERTAP